MYQLIGDWKLMKKNPELDELWNKNTWKDPRGQQNFSEKWKTFEKQP